MRVCLIYQGEFPRSERIEKTAKTLTSEGHEVYLLCNNYGKHPSPEERFGDVNIVRVRPTFKSFIVNRVLKFPIFLNPLWIWSLYSLVRRRRIEALQVIDVPLAVAVLLLGRLMHLPVLYDMWENYPEALKGWAQTDWRYLIFKNYRVARAVEYWVTRRVDHIFTVVDEARDRLIGEGIEPRRISIVTNGVDPQIFLGRPMAGAIPLDEDGDLYRLIYVGYITIERGLEDMVRALRLIRPQVPRVRLYIAGTGSDERRLRSIVDTEEVGDLVRFLGWLPFEQIHAYVLKSDLCLVPHVNNDFINTTVPNKLFQYMALAKPVLVSNAKPLARIVKQAGCGFSFESGNPNDAAAKIMDAYEARYDRGYGERGRRAVEERYTWEIASRDLVRVYRELSKNVDFNARRSQSEMI